jgi:hypothetical protein
VPRKREHVLGKYIISDKPMTEAEWAAERATLIDEKAIDDNTPLIASGVLPQRLSSQGFPQTDLSSRNLDRMGTTWWSNLRFMSCWLGPTRTSGLLATLPAHHGKPPPQSLKTTESLFAKNHEPFFNAIDPTETWTPCSSIAGPFIE